jgi:hypothetical protein
MTMLSTTAWVVHDLGLASAFGGSLFGKLALEPAVGEVADERERTRVEDRAWKRFSVWNTIGLAAVGLTWFAGRKLLSGREVSKTARALTITKDALVGASLGVGVAATVIGRLLAREKSDRAPASSSIETATLLPAPQIENDKSEKLEKAVNILGDAQLGLTAAILAVTSILAMESGKSLKFGGVSRLLP